MAVAIVRFGSPRAKDEGPRIGTVRRPPRGVKKQILRQLLVERGARIAV